MIIEKIDSRRESFSDYSLDGNQVAIGGVTVDLAAEEQDQEVIITFGNRNGHICRGLTPGCIYAAELVIPPRKYKVIEKSGEAGAEIEAETILVPLDVDAVTLRLWPVGNEAHSEINETMEEQYGAE
jgi:hypothetical protein